jgi:hypothetical protein
MTSDALAIILGDARLLQAKSASLALNNGWKLHSSEPIALTEDFHSTYSMRLQNLRRNHSPHAKQLTQSMEELVRNLQSTSPGTEAVWYTIEGAEEHDFIVLCSKKDVIGCLRTVSQLRVQSNLWKALWKE